MRIPRLLCFLSRKSRDSVSQPHSERAKNIQKFRHRVHVYKMSALSVSRSVCVLALLVGLLALFVGKYFFRDSREHTRYRYNSFAPQRVSEIRAKWFVDGKDYMSALADAIVAAEHEILITDWQMSPFIFLKRPKNGVTSLEWRLDKLMLKKAQEGIHIYIMLYWETKLAMDLGSDIVQTILKHENIEIIRHPSYSNPVHHPTTLLRWSHHEKIVVIDRKIAFVGGIDLAFGRWDTHSHLLADNYPHHPCVLERKDCDQSDEHSAKSHCCWVGKDYGNTFLGGGRSELNKPLDDYIDRRVIPRMPWHDVACSVDGAAASDVAKHFIQRYKAIKHDPWWKFWKKDELAGIDKNWEHSETSRTILHPSANDVKIQVLRSVDEWSANQPHEDSIYKAYIHAIENAEHLIYIENQFFISSQPKDILRKVKNQIQSALTDRIIHAYENAEDFHVIIILPLQPEFPGEWGTDSGKDLAAVSYWNYASLYTGEDSLIYKLKKGNIPATSIRHYLSVYGLRTHDIWPDNKFVTEIIYVHSKLMIVDDRLSIIGSANINDRSMLGNRDSEVNVIIEDKDMIDGTMNGETYAVGKFSHELRCHLMKEHLGLFEEKHVDIDLDVKDPLTYHFYTRLSEIAASNTGIYERVFHRKVLPTNQVHNFDDLKNWKTFEGLADVFPEEAKIELNKIRGRMVIFPALFLKDVLKPSAFDYLLMYVDSRGRVSELKWEDSICLEYR